MVTKAEEVELKTKKDAYHEASRQSWLLFHSTTGDYDGALKLVVSKAEEEALYADFEARRIEHFKFQLGSKAYGKALEVAVTEAEKAQVAAAQAA